MKKRFCQKCGQQIIKEKGRRIWCSECLIKNNLKLKNMIYKNQLDGEEETTPETETPAEPAEEGEVPAAE